MQKIFSTREKELIQFGSMLISGHVFSSAPNLLPETIAQISLEIAANIVIHSENLNFDNNG